MRLTLLILGIVIAVRAHAATIVVMTDRPAEHGAALEVALGNRGVDVARMPLPSGALRLDRAAVAQRAALDAGADAAIWIDRDGTTDVCAVSSDGRYFRHAPIQDQSPRMFAAIATSLLDELLAPPEGGVNVNVHVTVEPSPAPAPVAITPAPMPRVAALTPAPTPMIVEVAQPSRRDRTLVEIGGLVSPVSIGAEANVLFPLNRQWRVGGMGTVGTTFDGEYTIFGGAFELRRIGSGRRRHFDLGFLAGGAGASGDNVAFAGVRLNWTWEGRTAATSLGFAPLLVKIYNEDRFVPGIFASLRGGFSL